jgi:hypothetical protein
MLWTPMVSLWTPTKSVSGRVEQCLTFFYLGKFHHDLTATEAWNHGFYMGNHPQMPNYSA